MRKKDLRFERKQNRRKENKKFILKAAERVFAQKGYSLATMDDIAEEAQFSKATLYRYFKSKSDIFFNIIFSSFEETHQKVTKIMLNEMSAEDKLRELISYIVSFYHKKKKIARILFMERPVMKKIFRIGPETQISHSSLHPKIPYEFKAKMEQIFNIICEIINKGIESGEFRKVDVRDAAFIFGAMLRGFYFKGPLDNKEYGISKSTDLLLDFFLYGIKKNREARKGE